METVKKINGCQGLEGGRNEESEPKDVLGQ